MVFYRTIIDLINERDEHAKEAEEISHQMDDTMHEIILTRTDVQGNYFLSLYD